MGKNGKSTPSFVVGYCSGMMSHSVGIGGHDRLGMFDGGSDGHVHSSSPHGDSNSADRDRSNCYTGSLACFAM